MGFIVRICGNDIGIPGIAEYGSEKQLGSLGVVDDKYLHLLDVTIVSTNEREVWKIK
jgi:hypothetical protein